MDSSSKRAFLAAWLGWAFDGLDGFLFALVAIPFVHDLMPGVGMPQVTKTAGLIQATFLLGWALGGAFFGRIGDRLGRVRTMNLTILTYAVFTGLSFFAGSWWQLLIFRFISALGIGGEWAAGSALVSETLPERHRHWASATLSCAYLVGIILAALTVGALGSYPSRYVFLVGIIPALLTLWIRRAVPETSAWEGERRAESTPPVSNLFRSPMRRTTLMMLGLSTISLTTVFALLFFSTQVLLKHPDVASLAPPDRAGVIRHITIIYSLWCIVGSFVAGAIAKSIGYRKAFVVLFSFSFLTFFLGFHVVGSLASVEFWLSAAMFFGAGLFALYPLYVPPLFPVLLRTTGAGLCYNFGRLCAAIGTIAGAAIAASAGGPHLAIWYAGFLYVPGIALAWFAPDSGPLVVDSARSVS